MSTDVFGLVVVLFFLSPFLYVLWISLGRNNDTPFN